MVGVDDGKVDGKDVVLIAVAGEGNAVGTFCVFKEGNDVGIRVGDVGINVVGFIDTVGTYEGAALTGTGLGRNGDVDGKKEGLTDGELGWCVKVGVDDGKVDGKDVVLTAVAGEGNAVGNFCNTNVGARDGILVGDVGISVGALVGELVGDVGICVGDLVGLFVGDVGISVGGTVGVFVRNDGIRVGNFVGLLVSDVGVRVGDFDGDLVGDAEFATPVRKREEANCVEKTEAIGGFVTVEEKSDRRVDDFLVVFAEAGNAEGAYAFFVGSILGDVPYMEFESKMKYCLDSECKIGDEFNSALESFALLAGLEYI